MIPEASLLHHMAVLGKTGSGKTYTAKAEVVEPLLEAGRQVAIVDPTSAWWGLRLNPDGKSASQHTIIILGGPRGDLPLTENMGSACARLITEQLASVVFDTSLMTVGERTRWFTDFAVEIYRTIRQPLTLVLDEVHNFCPQGKVPDPATGKMLHAANQLFSGGRSRGIRLVGISQRPAKWHKDALTSVDTLVVHRMLAPQDREAVKAWIDGCGDAKKGREVLDSLAGLQRGEAWVWFPEGDVLRRGKSTRIRTFDSSATPDVTNARFVTVEAIDLGQVKAALAEAAKEAEANDPKHLRARIEQLEDDLAAALAGGGADPDANGTSAMQAEIDRLDAAVRDLEAERDGLRLCMGRFRTRVGEVVRTIEGLRETVGLMLDEPGSIPEDFVQPATTATRSPNVRTVEQEARRLAPAVERHTVATRANVAKPAPSRVPSGELGLTGAHVKVLTAAVRLWNMRMEATPLRVAVLAGYAADSGNFNNLLGRLSSAGAIERKGGKILPGAATGKLVADLDLDSERINQITITDAMQALVTGRHQQILGIVCRQPRKAWTAEEIAAALGLAANSGNFNNLLGYLSGRRLIVRERGSVRVNPELVI